MTAPVVTIDKIGQYAGQEVTLQGWLFASTPRGRIAFLMIRDGTGVIQAVAVKKELDEDLFERLRHLGQESSLIVTGIVKEDDRAKGGYEMVMTGAEIVSEAKDYPITP